MRQREGKRREYFWEIEKASKITHEPIYIHMKRATAYQSFDDRRNWNNGSKNNSYEYENRDLRSMRMWPIQIVTREKILWEKGLEIWTKRAIPGITITPIVIVVCGGRVVIGGQWGWSHSGSGGRRGSAAADGTRVAELRRRSLRAVRQLEIWCIAVLGVAWFWLGFGLGIERRC